LENFADITKLLICLMNVCKRQSQGDIHVDSFLYRIALSVSMNHLCWLVLT